MEPLHKETAMPGGASDGPRFDFHLAAAPRLLWKTRTARFYGSVKPQVIAGHIHVGEYVVDAETGRKLEAKAAPDGQARETNWVEWKRGRNIVHGSSSGDGGTKWSHLLRPSHQEAQLTAVGEVVYVSGTGKAGFSSEKYIHATTGYVLALNAQAGDLLWMYTTEGEVHHPPVVADGRVYVGDVGDVKQMDRHVYCLSAAPRSRLGECLWKYKINGLSEKGMVAGKTVYWGDYDGFLYAIDAKSGKLCWRFQGEAPVASAGPPCVLGDWVFVGSKDGYLYGLDARTGALRWKHFVVDEEAREAEADEKAQRASAREHEMDDWNEEERREWEAYDASLKKLLERDDEEVVEKQEAALPSFLDLFAWAANGRLFMLTTQGFLHCFELPDPVRSGR